MSNTLSATRKSELCCMITKAVLKEPEKILQKLESFNLSKEEIETTVRFLDDVTPWNMEKIDKSDSRAKISESKFAIHICENVDTHQLVQIVFTLCDHYNLDASFCSSAQFVEKMLAFFKLHRMTKNNPESELYFVEKTYNLIYDDERVQYGVLRCLAKKHSDMAAFLAVLMDIKRDDWPIEMQQLVTENQLNAQKEGANTLKKTLHFDASFNAGKFLIELRDLKPAANTAPVVQKVADSTKQPSPPKPTFLGNDTPPTKTDLCRFIIEVMMNGPERLLTALDSENFSQQELACMLEYLDDISSLYMARYDKYDLLPTLIEPELATALPKKIVMRQLLKCIFSIRTRYNLDVSLVTSAIFCRKMSNVLKAVRETDRRSKEIDLYYVQKICHLMRDDERMQFATLKYVSKCNLDEALYFALLMDVPRDNWPLVLRNAVQNEHIEEQMKKVRKTQQLFTSEYQKSVNGIALFYNHIAYLIDTPKKVRDQLYPFLEQEKRFGLDSEYEMSYSGEVGATCLIQLSGRQETMLIDVNILLTSPEFNESDWVELFGKIFALKNMIYGFALDGDLLTILNRFPYLAEAEFVKFKNVFCLRVISNKLELDDELCNKVYGEKKPAKNSLAALAEYFYSQSMPKDEQLAVWSERPFRFQQLKYAAMDSLMTYAIQNKLKKLVKANMPEEYKNLFKPISWPNDKQEAVIIEPDGDSSINDIISRRPPVKKTKAYQFSYDDLSTLVKTQNERFEKNPSRTLIKPSMVRYITDTMCAQLGDLLRRCGVNVIAGNNPNDILDKAYRDQELRVITCGRAVNKYPFGTRVINIPASSSTLDKLFMHFLDRENLYINLEELD